MGLNTKEIKLPCQVTESGYMKVVDSDVTHNRSIHFVAKDKHDVAVVSLKFPQLKELTEYLNHIVDTIEEGWDYHERSKQDDN